MSEQAISDSAQRLAEENNVDWRKLRGSGENGAVTEQDIVNYLSLVMRGDEAVNPTPEPLPEGMSAWPEELEPRRKKAQDLFSVPFSVPEKRVAPLESTPSSPWQTEPSVIPAPPEAPQTEAFKADKPFQAPPKTSTRDAFVNPVRALAPRERPLPSESPDVPRVEHEQLLKELEALKKQVASLEAEREKHIGELHQLSRLQETIALQKTEAQKLSALKTELQQTQQELAASRLAASRLPELEAHSRDLETRLARARAFRTRAKTEFERVMADNIALYEALEGAIAKRP